jgi:hypothetical protein
MVPISRNDPSHNQWTLDYIVFSFPRANNNYNGDDKLILLIPFIKGSNISQKGERYPSQWLVKKKQEEKI